MMGSSGPHLVRWGGISAIRLLNRRHGDLAFLATARSLELGAALVMGILNVARLISDGGNFWLTAPYTRSSARRRR
jgi:hypothetical protein